MHYDLGYFDLEQKTLQPLDNPFGPRLSPMSWYVPLPMSPGRTQKECGSQGKIRTSDQPLTAYGAAVLMGWPWGGPGIGAAIGAGTRFEIG